jgi:hypothetical protein
MEQQRPRMGNTSLKVSSERGKIEMQSRFSPCLRSLINEYGSFFRIDVWKVIGYRKTVKGNYR